MKLYAAREEDAHQGWVWLQDDRLAARCVIRIENPQSGDSVYCETLQIDENFLNQYNQHPRFIIHKPSKALVIGAWYRNSLGGLQTQSDVNLKVTICNSWWGKFKACTDHPQVVVRVAAWLGGVGLVLGVIGFVLGVVSILPAKN